MNIFKETLLDQTVKIERFFHRTDAAHHDPDEESAPCYMINFVEKGCFGLEVGKEKWRLDDRNLFLTFPEMRFRYRHFEERPTDVCLSVKFTENFAEEVFGFCNFSFQAISPVLHLNNRIAFLQRQIGQMAAAPDDALKVETLAAELLASAGQTNPQHKPFKRKQFGWYAERVTEICRLFETHYEDRHSLETLARAVGMSPFHLLRIFRELTARTPHQFLMQVRLSRAARQLLDGVSVTETCFACGFNNLSYFIRTFQKAFGTTPRQFQKRKDFPEKGLPKFAPNL